MDTLLADLAAARDATLPFFAADAAALARSYRPEAGKWTARQMLFHIADVEQVFLERLRRITAEAKPLLLAIDPDRWTTHLIHPARDLRLAGEAFRVARDQIIELIRTTPAAHGRSGVHSEKGVLTFTEAAGKALWHNRHHLGQVEAAVAGRVWTA